MKAREWWVEKRHARTEKQGGKIGDWYVSCDSPALGRIITCEENDIDEISSRINKETASALDELRDKYNNEHVRRCGVDKFYLAECQKNDKLQAKYDELEKRRWRQCQVIGKLRSEAAENTKLKEHAEAMSEGIEQYAGGGCIEAYYIEDDEHCLSNVVENYRKEFPNAT